MNASHTKYLTVIQICFQNSLQSTPSCFDVLANTHCKVKYTKNCLSFEICVVIVSLCLISQYTQSPCLSHWSEMNKERMGQHGGITIILSVDFTQIYRRVFFSSVFPRHPA